MNNKIIRINRDESELKFAIKFPKGKTISDVEDVIFLVKAKEETPLVSALILKLKSTSKIELVSPNMAVVLFETADYNNLEVGVLYKAALFCKWTGKNDFDENVEQLFDFQLIQNFHNNN